MPTTYEQRELKFSKNYIAEIQQKLHFCMNDSINLKTCIKELEDEVERLKMYLTDIVMAGPEDGGVLTDLARMALNPVGEESDDSVA